MTRGSRPAGQKAQKCLRSRADAVMDAPYRLINAFASVPRTVSWPTLVQGGMVGAALPSL